MCLLDANVCRLYEYLCICNSSIKTAVHLNLLPMLNGLKTT